MLNIRDELLPLNPYSRCGEKRTATKAIVLHWLAAPGQSAHECQQYFAMRSKGQDGFGSAHYIIDLAGKILRCMPEAEMAYHVGSSQIDPASKRIYTDLCRKQLTAGNPNEVTIGIEHCHPLADGKWTDETYNSSIQLVAFLCSEHGLDPMSSVMLHRDVVGWKNCPKYFVDHPAEFDQYKALVATLYKTLITK